MTFNSRTTAVQVSSTLETKEWADRVVFITGTTHGIGMETVRAFVSMKYSPTLVLANRNQEIAQASMEAFQKEFPDHTLRFHLLQLDLSSLESVVECARRFNELRLPLHVLLLNAGIFASKF